MLSIDEILAARERIRKHIFLSPCAQSESLSEQLGCQLYLKLDNLQMTGSFKERGSLNKILQLDAAQRRAGVVTASAGNHAQGVAHAARLCGIHATVVMPETTPLAKIRGTRDLGAEIVLHGRGYDEAFQRAQAIQARQGLSLVHAFDDPEVIAGQGTIGLELLEQVPELDVVVVPVGGGGLIAGIASAVKALRPETRIIGVEAARLPAMQASLAAGRVERLHAANTLADGIAVARVGEQTLPVVREAVDALVSVSEEEIAEAVMILLEREKTLAEGAGAAGFAALYRGRVADTRGKRVVVVISGGNIDMTMLAKLLERGLERDGRLARLKVVVPDRPGSIAELAEVIAAQQSNIMEISQNRAAGEVALEETEVQLLLETRGQAHVKEIIAAIRRDGLVVKQR